MRQGFRRSFDVFGVPPPRPRHDGTSLHAEACVLGSFEMSVQSVMAWPWIVGHGRADASIGFLRPSPIAKAHARTFFWFRAGADTLAGFGPSVRTAGIGGLMGSVTFTERPESLARPVISLTESASLCGRRISAQVDDPVWLKPPPFVVS